MTIRITELNGGSGAVVRMHGKPIIACALDIAEGRIQTIHLVTNPDKLRALASGRVLILRSPCRSPAADRPAVTA